MAHIPVPAETVYLRVKRKREDEPATHMVAEIAVPGAKKMREMKLTSGMFMFAETIEDEKLLEQREYVEALNKRLGTIARSSPSTSADMSITSTSAPGEPLASPTERVPSPSKTVHPKSYTIVPKAGVSPPQPKSRRNTRATAPPIVRASVDIEREAASKERRGYTVFEAIETPSAIAEPDPQMDEFASMVDDYLNLHPTEAPKPSPSPRGGQSSPVAIKLTDEDDYVYDVFYFALRDVNDVNELMAQESVNIGTVHGLPYWEMSSFCPDDVDSDDSVRDEADEDSNDEDYYANDYPDEEDHVSESDEEGELEKGWKPWRY